jgi:hypothetical protein
MRALNTHIGQQHIDIHGVTGLDWVILHLTPRFYAERWFARRLLRKLWKVPKDATIPSMHFTFTLPGGSAQTLAIVNHDGYVTDYYSPHL